jgi:hypothetical protein
VVVDYTTKIMMKATRVPAMAKALVVPEILYLTWINGPILGGSVIP